MSELLSSAEFWIGLLTVLGFLASYCYLKGYYRSFDIFPADLSSKDIFFKGLPGPGIVAILGFYLASEPILPWHNWAKDLISSSDKLSTALLPVTAVVAIVAYGLGKFRARRLRRSRERVEIRLESGNNLSATVIAYGKDLIFCFDPIDQRTVLIPWSRITFMTAFKIPRKGKRVQKTT